MRMTGVIPVLVATMMLLGLRPNVALAEETMMWGVLDWPPMHILEGEHKGHGLFDAIMDHFKAELPEYSHTDVVANPLRFWDFIKKERNFCHAASIVTDERLKYAYFSMPDAILLSNTVIMRADRATALGIDGSVSLTALLNNAELKGGLKADRSYGEAIDRVLAPHRDDANIFIQRDSDFGLSLFKMLLLRRIDYLIEYSYVAVYYEDLLKKKGASVSLTIEEATPYQLAYVACPRNRWGRDMIDRIDLIITKARPTAEYRKIMEMWQNEAGIGTIREAYDEVFMKTGPVDR